MNPPKKEGKCQRGMLLSKLKKVADHLRSLNTIAGRKLEPSLFEKQVQKQRKESCQDKHISHWIPHYTNFQLCNHPLYPLPGPPSEVQLLGSDLVGLCLCLRRNGLQDDCPKLGCRGTPNCLTRPIPTCHPSGLGEPPPKIVKISRPKVVPCAETCRLNRLKREKEKKERTKYYLQMGQKNYNETCGRGPFFAPCYRHDGSYARKRLKREDETQTNIEAYCKCKQLQAIESQCPNSKDDARSELNEFQVEMALKDKLNECKQALVNKQHLG